MLEMWLNGQGGGVRLESPGQLELCYSSLLLRMDIFDSIRI